MKFSKPSDSSKTERLFKEHYSFLCLYAYSVVKDQEAAKDIVQDFFISYWEKGRNITVTKTFKAYAIGAVKNLSLRYLNQHRNHQLLIKKMPLDEHEETKITEAPLAQVKVPKLLEQLPESRRNIFTSYVLDGMSYAEIAANNNISINTVKTQMKRAYAFLRNNASKDWLHIILALSAYFH